jgi:hypothetical protein
MRREQTKDLIKRLAPAAAAAVLCCFLATGRAGAVSAAGYQLSHTKARAASTSFTGAIYSNIPATTTVAPIYGFKSNPFTQSAPIPLQMQQGSNTSYGFNIKNNGNAPDQVLVIISPISDGGVFPGVSWDVQVDDASPFVDGLVWKNSGTKSAGMSGDHATSGITLQPGEAATFTLRVGGSNAPYGATMSFTVTLETVGDTAQYPGGGYTGFNALGYAGPASVSGVAFVPTIPPALDVTAPTDGTETPSSTVAVAGFSEPGATCTLVVSSSNLTASLVFKVPPTGSLNKDVPLFEGANQITISVRDWTNNSTSRTLNVTRDSTPPALALQLNNELVGPRIPIVGSVYDAQRHLSGYAVYYGRGTAPTTWKQISSGTSEVGAPLTTGTLATWDATGLSGKYTIKLTAADRAPFGTTSEAYQTVTLVNRVQLSGVLPVNTWTMVALPGMPVDADPTTFLGSSRYEVQYWDPKASNDPDMLQYKSGNIILNKPGQGFWVKPYIGPINYTVSAYVADTADTVTMHMYNGWNQIGSPYLTRGSFTTNFQWGQVQVRINAGTPTEQTKTMADAIASGWVDRQFYGYSNNGYIPRGLSDPLNPYSGYFVKTLRDCDFVFEPGAGIPGGIARIVRPQYEWKLQIAASAGDVNDNENYAALMYGAQETEGPDDSSEPPPVKPYVSVYFQNEDSAHNAARLALDTRAPIPVKQSKTWNFVVEVSDPGRQVTLSVPNADKLPENYKYRIKDEDTGVEFDPKQRQSYVFDASARARRFLLTSEKIGDLAAVTISRRFQRGWTLFSVPLEPEPTDVRAQLKGSLAKIQAFQYYDKQFYDPDSEGKVDIQAGLGYWIFLDSDTDLSFTGMRTDPAGEIEIPLPEGWSLIGNPFENITIDGSNISVNDGEKTLPLAEAAASGWLSPYIYEFDSTNGGYTQKDIGAPMSPWKGYVVKTLKACKITIGPPKH